MSHLLLEAAAESAVDCGYHPTITINMDSAQPVFSAKDILQAHIPLVSVNSILKKLSAAREQYHGACPTTAARLKKREENCKGHLLRILSAELARQVADGDKSLDILAICQRLSERVELLMGMLAPAMPPPPLSVPVIPDPAASPPVPSPTVRFAGECARVLFARASLRARPSSRACGNLFGGVLAQVRRRARAASGPCTHSPCRSTTRAARTSR